MLSHVAYAGSLAALAAGIDPRLGLFTATIAMGAGIGLLGGRASTDDVIIGNAMAWVLGLGVFFLALYTTYQAISNSTANANALFGSMFGITTEAATTATAIAAALITTLLLIARPLLFASLDPALAAGEASQAVGALPLVGLITAPAAAAQRLTNRPWPALALAGLLAVAAMWTGLALAYTIPAFPPTFTITAAATEYALAAITTRSRNPDRQPPVRQ